MALAVPRTWIVGEVVTAALLNQELRDQVNDLLAAWTSYTPTWGAATTPPVLGNGTLVGRYKKIGRVCALHVNLIPGSTSTFGAGSYNWALPFTSANVGCTWIGGAHLLGSDRWNGQTLVSPNATTMGNAFPLTATNTRTSLQNPTVPETLANGSQIRMSIVYETAA